MSKRIYIYGLRERFDSRYRYIGKTDNIKRRFRAHLREKTRCHRSHWIQGVLARGGAIEIYILASLPESANWQAVEKAWIEFGILECWPLTNGTMGGDGNVATPETKAKISAARKGQKLNAHQREVCVRNLRVCKVGDKLPESTRAAISKARTGMKFVPSHCKQISESKKKLSAEQVSEVLQLIADRIPQSQIAIRFGVTQPTISAIKNRKRKYLE